MGDKILDPALGLNQRIGAKALDRRGAGKDRAGAATLRNEATGKILIRCRRLGFPSDPFAQIPCAPPRKGAIAVDSAKVRQMLVPGLLARGIEELIVAGQAELGRDAIRYLRRDQRARSEHPARVAQDAPLQREANTTGGAPG